MLKLIKNFLIITIIIALSIGVTRLYLKYVHENKILKEIIARLEADSRIAEVLVTGVNLDEKNKKTYTTIKFLEYNSKGRPLSPKYFTFSGNIIQFQSLVVRFNDIYVKKGSRLKGKSAYIFWKVFTLDGANTKEYEITKAKEIPAGYKIDKKTDPFENKFWENFWQYALNPQMRKISGIKNAQIEAPGTMFIPGMLYTIKIEHDGGMRIDISPLSPILRGERIPE